ncbi:hypothetical protein BC832DRAFT_318962 [Gaertneriomyces semiglobifer]|nr:hypothetical protein BC832DRAFT_318962 [Gaertneriomyces semiglobifer]
MLPRGLLLAYTLDTCTFAILRLNSTLTIERNRLLLSVVGPYVADHQKVNIMEGGLRAANLHDTNRLSSENRRDTRSMCVPKIGETRSGACKRTYAYIYAKCSASTMGDRSWMLGFNMPQHIGLECSRDVSSHTHTCTFSKEISPGNVTFPRKRSLWKHRISHNDWGVAQLTEGDCQ